MAPSYPKQSSLKNLAKRKRLSREIVLIWISLVTIGLIEVQAASDKLSVSIVNKNSTSDSNLKQSTAGEDRQARSTGETILDLVNLVLDKNRDALRPNGTLPGDGQLQDLYPSRLSVADGFVGDVEVDPRDTGNSMQWIEDSNEPPLHLVNTSSSADESHRLSKMSHTTTTTVISTEAAPIPIVLELQPDNNQSQHSADLTLGDELVAVSQQELDDRHIPYDVMVTPAPQHLVLHNEDCADEPRQLESINGLEDRKDSSNNYTLARLVSSAFSDQAIETEMSPSSNQTAVGRSGGVQARSMQGGLTTRAAPQQISRPPYASYDNFSGDGALHQRAAAALDVVGPGSTKSYLLESQPESRSNSSSPVSVNGNEFKVNMTSEVLNSVSQISSHLNDDATGPRTQSSSSVQNIGDSNRLANLVSTLSTYDEDPEVKQQLQKLAPISQPIDLSPIPVLSNSQTGNDHLYNLPFQQRGHNNDRYTNDRSRLPHDRHEPQQQQQHQTFDDHRLSGSLSDTTTRHHEGSTRRFGLDESMQEQLQEILSAQQVGMANHRLSSQSSIPHAASLINVTAPMTPPLSASSAMDISLGDQASKSLLQANGGLNRNKHPNEIPPKANSSKRQTSSSGGSSGQMGGSNNYFMPQQLGQATTSTTLEPLYSQPANQLVSVTNGTNKSSFGDFQSDEDRLRADSLGGEMLAARGSAIRNAPHYSMNLNNLHHASGFRQPQPPSWPASLPTSYLSGSALQQASRYTQKTGVTGQAINNSLGANVTTQSPVSVTSSTLGSTNGFITTGTASTASLDMVGSFVGSTQALGGNTTVAPTISPTGAILTTIQSNEEPPNGPRRVLNLTRVEHISAECSNDLIRTVIVFNGTFKGIIYSSGYVRDPNCVYINGTGKSRYDFSIRLNQCGTLGRQEIHPPNGLSEVRRRDQVMWNTLSIQYNPIIEQEWDEHFRVSCEYGSDFWKTISFSPFNVETNTGSPVVFTVDPPQCQMEILRGHGMVGPRQETASGPVTVGDPLTLLIHMKSEKAGYDILVKNCVAHNGGHQKMQLIDSNGCVVNERFISPFRGTYNDLKHVTLYSYLKAFRFTGSPVLYLECEIHMCQSACPPQMCYWRRLSKRSANETLLAGEQYTYEDEELQYVASSESEIKAKNKTSKRRSRSLEFKQKESASAANDTSVKALSERVSLFQALEVRQGGERDPDALLASNQAQSSDETAMSSSLLCYRRFEVLGFLFTTGSLLLASICLSIGCCWHATSLRRIQAAKLAKYAFGGQSPVSHLAISVNQDQLSPSSSSANSSPPITAATTTPSSSSSSSAAYHHHKNNLGYIGRQAQQQNKQQLYQQNTNLYGADLKRHKERPFLAHY